MTSAATVAPQVLSTPRDGSPNLLLATPKESISPSARGAEGSTTEELREILALLLERFLLKRVGHFIQNAPSVIASSVVVSPC
jgi:hypothetical protein